MFISIYYLFLSMIIALLIILRLSCALIQQVCYIVNLDLMREIFNLILSMLDAPQKLKKI